MAADPVGVEPPVVEAVVDRVIDNAAVAVAALNRRPVVTARAMALAHRRAGGAQVFGLADDDRVDCEWAAWANGAAVRELDYHDTYLAAEYAHPADTIPPLVAVAQQCCVDGESLVRAIATAYEVDVALARGICLHEHKIDHVAHLGPAVAAGIGTLLGLAPETTYHAVGQALHLSCATRQSRKGRISSWKAFAPAHVGKLAIEAVDRCMRGEAAPSPIYEGADGVIARLLGGPEAAYLVSLPAAGEAKRAILETFPKEHAAEYQAQALIDLAFDLRPELRAAVGDDWSQVRSVTIHTSHHTHTVIGTGARDPEKLDPAATRETLDHSIAYVFAVAVQDGVWHHDHSYRSERAQRPDTVALWHKVRTVEDPQWTRRYHAARPRNRAFGGRAVIELADGRTLTAERSVARAHPLGERPFRRVEYVNKFRALSRGQVADGAAEGYLRDVERLHALTAAEVSQLNVAVAVGMLESVPAEQGVFGRRGRSV